MGQQWFLIAVECDGARYHSSSWARERDRLRQAVLEQKGWTFHRIWSTDWFYNRDVEVRKLLEAIESARTARAGGNGSVSETGRDQGLEPGAELGSGSGWAPAPVATSGPDPGPAPAAAEAGARRSEILRGAPRMESEVERIPYREASFEVSGALPGPGGGASDSENLGGLPRPLSTSPLVELHEASLGTVAECVAKIVEVEGPVHIEELGRRLSRLWGYKRAGGRIQRRVVEAVSALARRDLVRVSGSGRARFLEPAESRTVEVRDRGEVESATLRKVEMLPPVEVRTAILQAVERNIGIDASACAVEVARAFGFKSTSADLRRLVAGEAARLVTEGRLALHEEQLRLP